MLDAVKRLLLDGARPIDRTILVVDLLVLLVILGEWIRSEIRERRAETRERAAEQRRLKAEERAEEIKKRIAILQGMMREGRVVQDSVPDINNPMRAAEWRNSVHIWTEKTRALLKSYSPQAETAFLHNSYSFIVAVTNAAPKEYTELAERLNSLRGIIENPDVYL